MSTAKCGMESLLFTAITYWTGDEEPRKPACMRTKKSKGVPGEAPG